MDNKTKAKHRRDLSRIAKIKIQKTLEWLRPYLYKAKTDIPHLILPRTIKGYVPPKTKEQITLGCCHFGPKLITLATHNQRKKNGRFKVVPFRRWEILETLAHELAHFHEEEHGPLHVGLTEVIYRSFGLKEKCRKCKGTGCLSRIIKGEH